MGLDIAFWLLAAVTVVAALGVVLLRNIFRAARWHYPILRLFGKPPTDDAANGSAPHCAMASVLADKAGGFDPCPLLADYATEPNDLARSLFYAHGYMFTLE